MSTDQSQDDSTDEQEAKAWRPKAWRKNRENIYHTDPDCPAFPKNPTPIDPDAKKWAGFMRECKICECGNEFGGIHSSPYPGLDKLIHREDITEIDELREAFQEEYGDASE